MRHAKPLRFVDLQQECKDSVESGEAEAAELEHRRERLELLLSHLPEDEATALRCRIDGKTQAEIGEILGMAQPSVHYRLARAMQRLRWMLGVGYADLTPQRVASELTAAGLDVADVELLTSYLGTRCQQTTARRAGKSHAHVRARLYACIAVLEARPELAITRVFLALREQPQVLHSWVDCRRKRSFMRLK